jgi:hypothetical protein
VGVGDHADARRQAGRGTGRRRTLTRTIQSLAWQGWPGSPRP